MAEFTLLQLHVEDASFTAYAPFSGAGGESEDDGTDGDDASETESGGDGDGSPRLLALVAGLAFLVVAAVVVKKLRGGGEESG